MAKKKEIKTNAMRFLEKNKIDFQIITYECDGFIDGVHLAEELNVSLAETFKTLVTFGKSKGYYVFLIPVADELDLKKAAHAVNEKFIEMVAVKDITAVTGYVRGGCSPLGMKKQFPTVIHYSAQKLNSFYVSGGRLGSQIKCNPLALAAAINAQFADIAVD